MAGKKKSPTKKTAQEIREMIALIEEASAHIDILYDSYIESSQYAEELDLWTARANKIIGNPK